MRVEPSELIFAAPFDQPIRAALILDNRDSNQFVAYRVLTSKAANLRYTVDATAGVVLPQSCALVQVTLLRQRDDQALANSTDKFLVLCKAVADASRCPAMALGQPGVVPLRASARYIIDQAELAAQNEVLYDVTGRSEDSIDTGTMVIPGRGAARTAFDASSDADATIVRRPGVVAAGALDVDMSSIYSAGSSALSDADTESTLESRIVYPTTSVASSSATASPAQQVPEWQAVAATAAGNEDAVPTGGNASSTAFRAQVARDNREAAMQAMLGTSTVEFEANMLRSRSTQHHSGDNDAGLGSRGDAVTPTQSTRAVVTRPGLPAPLVQASGPLASAAGVMIRPPQQQQHGTAELRAARGRSISPAPPQRSRNDEDAPDSNGDGDSDATLLLHGYPRVSSAAVVSASTQTLPARAPAPVGKGNRAMRLVSQTILMGLCALLGGYAASHDVMQQLQEFVVPMFLDPSSTASPTPGSTS